jgi:hypothetical protein
LSLTALDENGNKQVSYLLSQDKYRQDWHCPLCNQQMSFVDAQLKIQHFRHLVFQGCENESEPESFEHLYLKQWIYNQLTAAGFKCEFEVKIGNRIGDVVVTTKSKKLHVIECQVSPISQKNMDERTIDYLHHHTDVCWIMHSKNYLTPYEEFHGSYRLKDVERESMDDPNFLYFLPDREQILKILFNKKKWAHGGGDCETIRWKTNEFVVPLKYLFNWGMIENWIEAKFVENARE